MAIPSASDIATELLRLISDGEPHAVSDLHRQLIRTLALTDVDAMTRIPSGKETVLANRLRNLEYRLQRRGLIEFADNRRTILITPVGRQNLAATPGGATK